MSGNPLFHGVFVLRYLSTNGFLQRRQWPPHPPPLQETRLLAEPLARALLGLLLGQYPLTFGTLLAAADFFDHVEVVLDILQRAVIGKLVQQRRHFLFCSQHVEFLQEKFFLHYSRSLD